MRRRNLLLTVVVILGLIVTLGLQGCGLIGGGGDEEGAEGESAEGMEGPEGAAEGAGPAAEGGPEAMPGEGGMGGPPPGGEPEGMGGEAAEGGPAPMGETPGEGAAAADGEDAATALVSEAMDAKHDGDYVAAREKLEEALQADPDHAEANRVLGWILAEMAASGQPSVKPQAIEHFQTFLQKGGTQEQVAEVEGALERMQ